MEDALRASVPSTALPSLAAGAIIRVDQARVAVVGLGYVGLPLAVEFGRQRPTLGFDIDAARIATLSSGLDANREVAADALAAARSLHFTADPALLAGCNTFIIAVPTPLDGAKRPDLRPLLSASRMVGAALKPGDVVIYESTVFPGATEEHCIPALEAVSGLRCNRHFHVGYSPERMVPGDPSRPIASIIKVTSGSNPAAAAFVDDLYRSIVTAGTHRAPSIRVAEAAKIVENIQRDVNIALMNELSVVFSHLGIDTGEVLEAAGTKWNFIGLRPGLVGGHCIGVDPHYMIHRSMQAGHLPRLMLAARTTNDAMADHAARLLLGRLADRGVAAPAARILVLGITFKENCRDLRNSQAVELVKALRAAGAAIDVSDPLADRYAAEGLLGQPLLTVGPEGAGYDAVALVVPHGPLVMMGAKRLRRWLRPGGVLFDVKGALGRDEDCLRL